MPSFLDREVEEALTGPNAPLRLFRNQKTDDVQKAAGGGLAAATPLLPLKQKKPRNCCGAFYIFMLLRSEIQVFDRQGVLLNKFTTRLHHIAHQLREDIVGLGKIIHLHL